MSNIRVFTGKVFVGHLVAGTTKDGHPTASYGDDWRSDLLEKDAVPEVLSQKARESKEWAEQFAGQVFDLGALTLHVYVNADPANTKREINVYDCACSGVPEKEGKS